MASRLSIYHPPGRLGLRNNPFGKDVANLQLFRALALHGGFEQLDILSLRPTTDEDLARELLEDARTATRLIAGSILNTAVPAGSGALLRGQPDLHELAWLRRRGPGDRAYSLLGLVHTLAPPAMRQTIAMSSIGPVHPWDAIICTSPSVRDVLVRMFEEWGEHLAERSGGRPPPQPALPILPLGVDAGAFAAFADRPEARARLRAELELSDNDILATWVGRLSYYEKAFPQAMFRALQQAAERTGARLVFAMAGWFPAEADRARYEQAAAALAPGVRIRFLDGNDRVLLGELWAAGDIFLSLVDNIQETFGITPLEAMAAGLPVVVSDWDGYRSTVRDGVDGFLIPTLGGPANGLGAAMTQRHVMEIDSYQAFAGAVAQHTAVHVGRCADALTALIRSPDLRRRMGQAGRERVRSAFDWPVVARQYHALVDDLAQIRARSPDPPARHRASPVKGDPFAEFAGFATQALSLDLPLSAAPGLTADDVMQTRGLELEDAFRGWRASLEECAQALDLIVSGQARTVREVLLAFPVPRRRAVELGLAWLAKAGFLDWLA